MRDVDTLVRLEEGHMLHKLCHCARACVCVYVCMSLCVCMCVHVNGHREEPSKLTYTQADTRRGSLERVSEAATE